MNYKIIYTRRKTIRICVNADNEIIVRCPKGTSKSYIDNFVNSKSEWINDIIEKNNLKLSKLSDFYEFKSVFLFGKKAELHLNSNKNYISDDGVHLTGIKNLKKLYTINYKAELASRVEEISRGTGLNYQSIAVRDYKSRWGCCNLKGEIVFNYKIFMLPKHLIDYCILHELCHTVHFDHSKSFWKLVERYMPDYKAAKKELKNYNFVTRLY